MVLERWEYNLSQGIQFQFLALMCGEILVLNSVTSLELNAPGLHRFLRLEVTIVLSSLTACIRHAIRLPCVDWWTRVASKGA